MKTSINSIEQLKCLTFDKIFEDPLWNIGTSKELNMHKIHLYPAKFPALVAQNALKYVLANKPDSTVIGDIFCGCGTVALESKVNGIDFWGSDINPVATLISYSKTVDISIHEYSKRLKKIITIYSLNSFECSKYNDRLLYWYDKETYDKLFNLLQSIRIVNKNGKYRKVFYMIFSGILKKTSRWLNSSIKPQIDPSKQKVDPLIAFKNQSEKYLKSIDEIQKSNHLKTSTRIKNINILRVKKNNFLDAIITSPPYVTSYEYADLHQLSSLWLEYTDDYTLLRKDSIGSLYHLEINDYVNELTSLAHEIVDNLSFDNRKQQLVARYYYDMKKVVSRCWEMLKENGYVIFVIGDTEYKNVKIKNAEVLAESMIQFGFEIVEISKRKINGKFLPSHRDVNGKFTSEINNSRQIYSQEYIIIGKKLVRL